MAHYAWTLYVTDADGRRAEVSDDTFTNPYVSDETAQQVAELVLTTLAPLHAGDEGGGPQAVEVGVWRDKESTGDPLATARWSPEGA